MLNNNLNIKRIFIVLLWLFFIFSCEDELINPSVSKSVSNDNFKLTMSLSDDIVRKDSNIKVDVELERTSAAPFFLPSKVLGEWAIQQIDNLQLNEDSLEILYEFFADSTFTIKETYSFDIKSLGSQVIGDWSVTSDSDYPDFQVIETDTISETTTWMSADTTYTSIVQTTIIKDTTKFFDYSFFNNYEMTLTSKLVYEITNIIKADTSYQINTTTVIETTRDTTIVADSIITDVNGFWSYVEDSTALIFHFYNIPGGDTKIFTISFDVDQADIPEGSYMYWSRENRTMVLKKTGSNTGFSAPSDSTASFAGGWLFAQTGDQLTISTTLNGTTETGEVTFDTQGSTVPVGGNIFWTTDQRLITFEKTADAGITDPNFEGLDMTLTMSALGGSIYTINSSSVSSFKSFTVNIGSKVGDYYTTTAFFKPISSAGPNGHISVQFDELILSISIYIIKNQ